MKTDYFDIMARQANCSLKAAELLERMLEDYQPEKLPEQRDEMHHIEHSADEIRHEAMKALSKDFITPIEQDDLLQLVQILDDVTDAIDEVAIDLYMYQIAKLPERTKELAALMIRCVRSLQAAIGEFRHFKRSQTLAGLLVEVNTMESRADSAYIEALRELFTSEKDPIRVLGVKAIYDSLESCCDLCEHAADVMENVAMNNT